MILSFLPSFSYKMYEDKSHRSIREQSLESYGFHSVMWRTTRERTPYYERKDCMLREKGLHAAKRRTA